MGLRRRLASRQHRDGGDAEGSRHRGHRRTAETKEYLGGFWIVEAPDLDAALAIAKQASVACGGPVEVRPFQDEPAE